MRMLRGMGLSLVGAIVLAIAGCPGPDTTIEAGDGPDGGCDACSRDGGGLDGGDTGLGGRDTGVVASDTGVGDVDTGTVEGDTGVIASDTGVVASDTGVVASDAGVVASDTGVVASDTGVVAPDATVVDVDAATGAPDASTGGSDAGHDGGGVVRMDASIDPGMDAGVLPIADASIDRTINGCSQSTAFDFTTQSSVTITTSGLSYVPACIRVSVGTIITVNAVPSFGIHPLRAGTVAGLVATPDPTSPIPSTDAGTSVSFLMPTPGAYGYYCNNHFSAGMFGAVFVE